MKEVTYEDWQKNPTPADSGTMELGPNEKCDVVQHKVL